MNEHKLQVEQVLKAPFALRALSALVASVVLVLLASCAGSPKDPYANAPTAYLGPNGDVLYYSPTQRQTPTRPTPSQEPAWSWWGHLHEGSPLIVIDLSEQLAFFYKSGVEVGRSEVSTGREGYMTPTGKFSVTQKNPDHISNLYGDYVDANGNVLVANVGIHRDRRPPGTRFQGAPMPYFMRVSGAVGMHAGYLPGYPASHGCIRLPKGAAMAFFENAPLGTPVRIIH